MTTQGMVTTTIAAPPEAVWPWVAQLEKHGDWSPKPYKVERTSGESGAVGSRYRSFGWIPGDKQHQNDVEITEVVPQQRLKLRADDAQGAFEDTYELRPVGSGTEVTFRLVFPQMKGLSALLVPVLFPLVGKSDMRKRLGLLKAKVESS